MMNQEHHSLFD